MIQGGTALSHRNLTHWIEDAEAREFCRDAVFLMGVEEREHLYPGAIVATVAKWWHHSVTKEMLPVQHHVPDTSP
jgi:hypothetical protein